MQIDSNATVRKTLRLPKELAAWVDAMAEKGERSANRQIIKCLKEIKAKEENEAA